MHPVIRISIFLIFTYFIVQAKPGQLLLAGFLLFYAGLFQPKKYTLMIWEMIWRLKWFYISIFILFNVFTPNEINSFSETTGYLTGNLNSELYFSVIKIVALMLIVIAVIILIVSIPRNELIASLIYLTKPFALFGFSSERFAVRVYLIVEFVELLPNLIRIRTESSQGSSGSKISKIVFSLRQIIKEVHTLAEQSECKKIQYEKINLPDLYQWSYIFIIIGLFYLSDILFTEVIF